MGKLLLGVLLVVCSVFVADLVIAGAQSRAHEARVGSEDVLRDLNERVLPGLTRAEVEAALQGFCQCRVSQSSPDEYLSSYRYWYVFIPPWSAADFKPLGSVEVVSSKEWRVKGVKLLDQLSVRAWSSGTYKFDGLGNAVKPSGESE